MKKLLERVFLAALLAGTPIYMQAQELTAKKIRDNAVEKDSPEEAVKYIQSEILKLTSNSEKRASYAFLGSLQESLADFSGAQLSYAKAAGLAAAQAEGMPKKSSERLVLDAVRCALSTGDTDNAENYLNSKVRNSKNTEIQATIKLYEQWCLLTKAEKFEDMKESQAMMKAYLNIDSMKSVKPSLLLTLWYITGEDEYAKQLTKEFPSSMESGIVNGKIQIYPAPFWYFLPRKTTAVPLTQDEVQEKTPEPAVTKETEKITRYQLGLFRDKNNAENYARKVSEKGFSAYTKTVTKPSGTIYYTVVVDEVPENNISQRLKSAGFECYAE